MPKELRVPNVRFNLKSHDAVNDKSKKILIILVFRYKGKKLVYSTGEKVISKYWDNKAGKAKNVKNYYEEHKELNARLKDFETTTQQIFIEYDYGNINPQDFKLQLDYRTGKQDDPSIKKKPTFFEFIQLFIAERKTRSTSNKKKWDKFPGVYNHLKNYAENELGKEELSYDDIDWDFKNRFETWLYKTHSHSQNNAAKILQIVKQFMREEHKREYHNNTKLDQQGFSIKNVKVKNKIRLTPEEVKALIDLDLSDRLHFDRVRDMFIAACFSGLRISDWKQIDKTKLIQRNGRLLLQLMTVKSKSIVKIPVLPELYMILEKYDFQLPTMEPQPFNRSIKKVLKLAIPESTFLRKYSESGETKSETAYKWEYASSHAGRRTFASNQYKKGWSLRLIKEILGHATEAQTEEYMDISNDELAEMAAGAMTVDSINFPKLKIAK